MSAFKLEDVARKYGLFTLQNLIYGWEIKTINYRFGGNNLQGLIQSVMLFDPPKFYKFKVPCLPVIPTIVPEIIPAGYYAFRYRDSLPEYFEFMSLKFKTVSGGLHVEGVEELRLNRGDWVVIRSPKLFQRMTNYEFKGMFDES